MTTASTPTFPPFALGLDVWSRGDGTPGTNTYASAPNAAFVPADSDFSGCLEITKSDNVTKLRHMGQTPLVPGCYLRITARVKAISGTLPSVRIAGWAGQAGNVHVTGLTETATAVTLSEYGKIYEISAIVGSGLRPGVDLVWGTRPQYGHFGLDLIGGNGGVVRIDDLTIEDVSAQFLRQMLSIVDVRDYGAVGDGSTDDSAAFEAADRAADGRTVLVPAGTYLLNDHVTINSRIQFEGTLTMPEDKRLALIKNYDLPAYIDAFGDEELAFKKALQVLVNNADHESLDMGGRRIKISAPIDVQKVVANRTSFATRRVIRNGQIEATNSAAWTPDTATSVGTYDPSNPFVLRDVANVANIQVGSLVEGAGVGREIFVKSRDIGAGELRLSAPLFDAAGTQTFTFTRFKYMLDFSGFSSLSKFALSEMELQCLGYASAIMLAQGGSTFQVRDCYITRPKNRGITSIGLGCQGMLIDRCQILSDESSKRAQDRISIGLNTNANDVKLRDNRVVHLKHFAVLGGSGSVITGNHWFMGDGENNGIRKGGLIFTTPNVKTTITGNYVDNNFIEWTNEHDATPDYGSQFSFGGLTITGNTFTVNNVAPWFTWIVIKPYGQDHFINGLNISGNVFKSLNGNIDRVESVDTTYATLNHKRCRNVMVEGNTFNAVTQPMFNPVVTRFERASDAKDWVLDFAEYLPFGGRLRRIESVVIDGELKTGSRDLYTQPRCQVEYGSLATQARLTWSDACRGRVMISGRMDNPT